jgi:hypothetical protein
METNQSFEHEFYGEPEFVLFNLKQLLFSIRWSSEFTQNYQYWLVSVVNDCFYYFLRKSEPIYAHHCLQLAEFYFRQMARKGLGELSMDPTVEIYSQSVMKDPEFVIADALNRYSDFCERPEDRETKLSF